MSPSPADGLVSTKDSATDSDSIPVRCIALSKSVTAHPQLLQLLSHQTVCTSQPKKVTLLPSLLNPHGSPQSHSFHYEDTEPDPQAFLPGKCRIRFLQKKKAWFFFSTNNIHSQPLAKTKQKIHIYLKKTLVSEESQNT